MLAILISASSTLDWTRVARPERLSKVSLLLVVDSCVNIVRDQSYNAWLFQRCKALA